MKANYYAIIGNDGRINERPQGQFVVPQSYSSAPGQSLQGGERGSSFPAGTTSKTSASRKRTRWIIGRKSRRTHEASS